jgi:hypothetical protein
MGGLRLEGRIWATQNPRILPKGMPGEIPNRNTLAVEMTAPIIVWDFPMTGFMDGFRLSNLVTAI